MTAEIANALGESRRFKSAQITARGIVINSASVVLCCRNELQLYPALVALPAGLKQIEGEMKRITTLSLICLSALWGFFGCSHGQKTVSSPAVTKAPTAVAKAQT